MLMYGKLRCITLYGCRFESIGQPKDNALLVCQVDRKGTEEQEQLKRYKVNLRTGSMKKE